MEIASLVEPSGHDQVVAVRSATLPDGQTANTYHLLARHTGVARTNTTVQCRPSPVVAVRIPCCLGDIIYDDGVGAIPRIGKFAACVKLVTPHHEGVHSRHSVVLTAIGDAATDSAADGAPGRAIPLCNATNVGQSPRVCETSSDKQVGPLHCQSADY